MQYEFIPITKGIQAAISEQHRFTTDSVLLARFSAPKKNERVAEFCAGCGAISLLWFGEGETPPLSVTGFELMEDAHRLFSLSIEKNSLSDKVKAVCCDLNQYKTVSELVSGGFDLVVCNPPYFESGFGSGARQIARQETELDIFAVCRAAAYALKYGGRLCVCFKPQRLADLLQAMRESKIEPKTIRPVLAREGEAPHLLLVEGKRGANPQLNWKPALILHNPDGSFTDEYRDIYRMR